MDRFEIILLEEAKSFIEKLEHKAREKIIFNLWKSKQSNDPEIFKKLNNEIWEFRTKYQKKQYRLLAFWDKRNNRTTLVVCSHGFIKKTQKTPNKEIDKAKKIYKQYFNLK